MHMRALPRQLRQGQQPPRDARLGGTAADLWLTEAAAHVGMQVSRLIRSLAQRHFGNPAANCKEVPLHEIALTCAEAMAAAPAAARAAAMADMSGRSGGACSRAASESRSAASASSASGKARQSARVNGTSCVTRSTWISKISGVSV